MPLIIKGIMTPQDAEKCVQHQVDGILVSNHGGRIVDTSLATIEALPSIADCVGDQIEIFLDSGSLFVQVENRFLSKNRILVCFGSPPRSSRSKSMKIH